jgi:hypothetical protein
MNTAMTAGEEHAALLRAYFQGDEDTFTARARSIAPDGFAPLVHAAFVIAARRMFAPQWTRAAVVRYVADTRKALSERPGLVDPRVAEHELCRALGGEVTSVDDSRSSVATATAQLIVLKSMTVSLRLDEDGLDDLVKQSLDEAGR